MDCTFVKENWPIVYFKLKGDVNKEGFDNFLNEWSSLYVKSSEINQKFTLIVDINEIGKVSPRYVMEIGKFLNKIKKLTEAWMEKTIIITEQTFINSLLNILFTFYTPVRPFQIIKNKKELKELIN